MIVESSFGDRGTRFRRFVVRFAVLELVVSRGGICRLRPRGGRLGRFGVIGKGATCVSSLDVFAGSRNAGDGESVGFSSREDHDLVFGGISANIVSLSPALFGCSFSDRESSELGVESPGPCVCMVSSIGDQISRVETDHHLQLWSTEWNNSLGAEMSLQITNDLFPIEMKTSLLSTQYAILNTD